MRVRIFTSRTRQPARVVVFPTSALIAYNTPLSLRMNRAVRALSVSCAFVRLHSRLTLTTSKQASTSLIRRDHFPIYALGQYEADDEGYGMQLSGPRLFPSKSLAMIDGDGTVPLYNSDRGVQVSRSVHSGPLAAGVGAGPGVV